MSRARARIERGNVVAFKIMHAVFRIVVFCIFAPDAWRAATAGETLTAGVLLACAIGLGCLFTPHDG